MFYCRVSSIYNGGKIIGVSRRGSTKEIMRIWYTACVVIFFQSGNGEEVKRVLDIILSLVVTIVGGIVVHYAIKWLDNNNDDD